RTVLFTITWVRSSRAPQTPLVPAAMEAQALVERVLGTRPVECGRFLITKSGRPAASSAELRRAVSCVTEHAARRTPAWMLQQLRGIDSWVARGLMTGRDGRVQMFSFDDDPSGGGSADPSFTASHCGSPSVGGGTIRCRDDRERQDLLQSGERSTPGAAYSDRSALSGSSDAARRAGSQVAPAVTNAIAAIATVRLIGSIDFTP